MVDARGDDGLDGRRQRYGVDTVLQPVGAPFALEIAALRDCGGELFDKERVALRALDDIAGKRGERRILTEMLPQQPIRIRPFERRHHDLTKVRVLHEGSRKARPEIDDEQCGSADDGIC